MCAIVSKVSKGVAASSLCPRLLFLLIVLHSISSWQRSTHEYIMFIVNSGFSTEDVQCSLQTLRHHVYNVETHQFFRITFTTFLLKWMLLVDISELMLYDMPTSISRTCYLLLLLCIWNWECPLPWWLLTYSSRRTLVCCRHKTLLYSQIRSWRLCHWHSIFL